MSAFPTEEQRKFAKQMEASYNDTIPDHLDQVPSTLLQKYGPTKSQLDIFYISFLHFKHLSEQRHCFLISRHHAIQLKLLNSSTQLETLLAQNRSLLTEIQSLKQLVMNLASVPLSRTQVSTTIPNHISQAPTIMTFSHPRTFEPRSFPPPFNQGEPFDFSATPTSYSDVQFATEASNAFQSFYNGTSY